MVLYIGAGNGVRRTSGSERKSGQSGEGRVSLDKGEGEGVTDVDSRIGRLEGSGAVQLGQWGGGKCVSKFALPLDG